jgi:hypothetical protein
VSEDTYGKRNRLTVATLKQNGVLMACNAAIPRGYEIADGEGKWGGAPV